jgi:hypothetical protein
MPRPEEHTSWTQQAQRPTRSDLAAPATQIVRDREDYLGQGIRDIGRRIADDQVELFVTGEPAMALQQQFERLAPEYIALHDIGTSATLRLLGSLAGASGARVQRLSIRRQGHGVALAVLQFVEVPLSDDNHVRIYTTDINADTNTRHQMAMVLLARSRLAVLMVGELPPHALTTALKPLSEALAKNPWPNRDMLLLPLGSATTLGAQAAQLVGKSGVVVRVTPQAARPTDAWSYISGAWNRLGSQVGGSAPLNTELATALPRPPVPMPEAPTQAMDLTPSPAGHHAPIASPVAVRWTDYALRCAAIKGVVSCCVFDLSSQRPLAHTGGAPAPERLAIQGGLLLDAMTDAARQLGLGSSTPEASISVGSQHLLLRPVPGHPGIVVHMALQASASNLTLARMQLERVSPPI